MTRSLGRSDTFAERSMHGIRLACFASSVLNYLVLAPVHILSYTHSLIHQLVYLHIFLVSAKCPFGQVTLSKCPFGQASARPIDRTRWNSIYSLTGCWQQVMTRSLNSELQRNCNHFFQQIDMRLVGDVLDTASGHPPPSSISARIAGAFIIIIGTWSLKICPSTNFWMSFQKLVLVFHTPTWRSVLCFRLFHPSVRPKS